MFIRSKACVIDRDVSFAKLKALLHEFVSKFFEREVQLRFRPSYFPFTEPSAEVDVLAESRPLARDSRLRHGASERAAQRGHRPRTSSGYAFGMGVERLAMLRYGVDDLRSFFENDLRFLEQFP